MVPYGKYNYIIEVINHIYGMGLLRWEIYLLTLFTNHSRNIHIIQTNSQ